MRALRVASLMFVVAFASGCGSDSSGGSGGSSGKDGGAGKGGTSAGGTSAGGTSNTGGTPSGGSGGTSAGGTAGSSTGGTTGDGGDPCQGDLTGNPTCDQCLGSKCCPEIKACAANDQCVQLVQCIRQHCGADAGDLLQCALANCSNFIGGATQAQAIQTCQQNNCPTECQF